MIDHITLPVSDLARSAAFYDAVLAVLGDFDRYDDEDAVGFGNGTWEFGVALGLVAPVHLALTAAGPNAVRAFYAAALAAGGRCNGAPGLRPQYGSGYYAAFVRDPDGHNIEAVHRGVADTSDRP
ncbi:MAG: VOC family protein [Pseudomonadota bacterium]